MSWQIRPFYLIRLLQPQTQDSRSQVDMPYFGVPADYPLPCLSETLLEAPWPPPQPLFSRGHIQQTSFITRHLPFPCQAPLHLGKDFQDTQPTRVLQPPGLPPPMATTRLGIPHLSILWPPLSPLPIRTSLGGGAAGRGRGGRNSCKYHQLLQVQTLPEKSRNLRSKVKCLGSFVY